MTRYQALSYIYSRYRKASVLAGIDESDDEDGFGPAIDDALLDLAPSKDPAGAVVGGADIQPYRALLRYHALLQLEEALLPHTNGKFGRAGMETEESKQLAAIRVRLARAQREIELLGYQTSGQNTASLSPAILHLGFLSPRCDEYGGW